LRAVGTVSLVGLGLVSETVYLAVVMRLPWWRYGDTLHSWSQLLGRGWGRGALCVVGIGVLMAAYLGGWYAVRHGAGSRRVVWGFAVLFALTLFWLLPITSDLFTYLVRADLFTDLGVNPLLHAPLQVPDGSLLSAYPSPYTSQPSIYGPVWLLLSAPGTLGREGVAGGLSYLKGLAVAGYLSCAWFLERILRQMRPQDSTEGLYLFAWNPLVVLMAVGDGHNDVVMMAAVLLAYWLLLNRRWLLSFAILALSVWIKYVSAMLVPLIALYALRSEPRADIGPRSPAGWRDRWRLVWRGGLVAASISALVCIPFAGAWGSTPTDPWLPNLAERLLWPSNWVGAPSDLAAWTMGGGVVLFGLAYLVLAARLLRGPISWQRLMNASFAVALLAFVLGAARSQPWHLLWPASLAGLSDLRWAWPLIAGLSAMMLVVQVWVEWGAPGLA
jgi:hypothetical protein